MKIVGITACPTGIAHTYMAAEALEKKAKELGYAIKVETRGSGGAKNVLTAEEIKEADAIIVAADTQVPMDRFHDVLVELVHNPLVTDWIQQSHRLETDPALSALIPPARQRSMSPQLEAQHQKIYEAIRDHKSEHAYFYMKEHLEFVLESYQEYFAMFY